MQRYRGWRKPVALLLIVLFLFSSAGVTLYAHACTCKGSSVSFSPEKKCCCTHSKAAGDCCKDTALVLKIKGKYQPADGLGWALSKADLAGSPVAVSGILLQARLPEMQAFYRSNNSPPFLPVPLFLLDRSILI